MRLLSYPSRLLRCCKVVAKEAEVVAKVPGWLLRCCYAVARVPGVVAKVLLCGC